MMAKMFYTLEEAKAALGKSEDQIKQLAREGRLREFRDGPRLMFKADQVELLKSEMSSDTGAAIDLGPSDSGVAIGLADSKSPGGTGSGMANLTLADTDAGRGGIGSGIGSGAGGGIGSGVGSGIGSGAGVGSGAIGFAGSGLGSGAMGISGSGTMGINMKEDTALAADLGLSGTVGGVPSPGRGAGTGLSGSTSGSRSGIDVFQSDEVDRVDPMAQTAINSGINEQINLEGVGSGSGLLDLTRESDDTSLGAELLDEIAPTASGIRRSPSDTGASSGAGMVMSEPRGPVSIPRGSMPSIQMEAPDPLAPAFGMASLGAAAGLIFTAFALVTGILGTHPDILKKMGAPAADGGFSFMVVLLMSFAAPVVLFIFGLLVGKMGRR